MKTVSSLYLNGRFSVPENAGTLVRDKVQLVLGFGDKNKLLNKSLYTELRQTYPSSDIVLCSTAGEIHGNNVYDDTVAITAIEFEKTSVRTVSVDTGNYAGSYEAGKALLEQVEFEGLAYVLVLSDGSAVNGSELVRGINTIVKNRVLVTGGLAGDGITFESTCVGLNGVPTPGKIVAIAFYGNSLVVSHGSMGGWDIFGPERVVTKSEGNQLFEIEGQNALTLYKTYLGSYADELPGSALLFPLAMKSTEYSEPLVRTILSIDQQLGSMTFAGDIPEGSQVRFMRANFDKIIDAASTAAGQAFENSLLPTPKLAILISCVGRKIILGSRTDEEIEAVAAAFGQDTQLTGFYSYGEISPFLKNEKCELHNQTMTITAFDEI